MEARIPEGHSLRRLFGMLTERSFTETLGWPDFKVTEYLANLLVEFAHVDSLHRIKNQQGQTVETVVELLYESESSKDASDADREREVHRHIGDFTLFLAGLFPEYLRYIKTSELIYHKDYLVDYMKAGKRSYGIVASFDSDPVESNPTLFHKLSTNFEICVAGLGLVRRDLAHMQDPAYGQAKKILLH